MMELKYVDKFVLPELIVVPVTVAPLTESAVKFPEKLGEPTVFTVGRVAVPPVVMLYPFCTNVWLPEIVVLMRVDRFEDPLKMVTPDRFANEALVPRRFPLSVPPESGK